MLLTRQRHSLFKPIMDCIFIGVTVSLLRNVSFPLRAGEECELLHHRRHKKSLLLVPGQPSYRSPVLLVSLFKFHTFYIYTISVHQTLTLYVKNQVFVFIWDHVRVISWASAQVQLSRAQLRNCLLTFRNPRHIW